VDVVVVDDPEVLLALRVPDLIARVVGVVALDPGDVVLLLLVVGLEVLLLDPAVVGAPERAVVDAAPAIRRIHTSRPTRLDLDPPTAGGRQAVRNEGQCCHMLFGVVAAMSERREVASRPSSVLSTSTLLLSAFGLHRHAGS